MPAPNVRPVIATTPDTTDVANRENRLMIPFVGRRPAGVACAVKYGRCRWLPIPKTMAPGKITIVDVEQSRGGSVEEECRATVQDKSQNGMGRRKAIRRS